jgi:hypothetical protein
MTAAVQKLLVEIDALSDPEKQEITVEILRRSTNIHYGELSEEALTSVALDRFIELDEEETHGQP